MTFRWLLAPTIILLCPGCGDDRPPVPPAAPMQPASSNAGLGDPLVVEGELRLDSEELLVEGVSQCAGVAVHHVRLVNEGPTDETILRTISSCGCARIDLEPGAVVPAGGEIEVPLTFKAWGAARRKAHEIRFILSGDRLGPLLRMDVEITSPLRTIPSAAQQALHPDGGVRIISSTETPFSILALDPPIPASIEAEPGQARLVIDWTALGTWAESEEARSDARIRHAEDGTWDHIVIEVLTDHPGCDRLALELYSARHTSPVWNK